MTLTREIDVLVLTTEQKVLFAIECARKVTPSVACVGGRCVCHARGEEDDRLYRDSRKNYQTNSPLRKGWRKMNTIQKIDKFIFGKDEKKLISRRCKIVAYSCITAYIAWCVISGFDVFGNDIVKDLSGYMTINPGESMQNRQMKESYNFNRYLEQKDKQNNQFNSEIKDTFRRMNDTINRSNDALIYHNLHNDIDNMHRDYDMQRDVKRMQSNNNYEQYKQNRDMQMSLDVIAMQGMVRNAQPVRQHTMDDFNREYEGKKNAKEDEEFVIVFQLMSLYRDAEKKINEDSNLNPEMRTKALADLNNNYQARLQESKKRTDSMQPNYTYQPTNRQEQDFFKKDTTGVVVPLKRMGIPTNVIVPDPLVTASQESRLTPKEIKRGLRMEAAQAMDKKQVGLDIAGYPIRQKEKGE